MFGIWPDIIRENWIAITTGKGVWGRRNERLDAAEADWWAAHPNGIADVEAREVLAEEQDALDQFHSEFRAMQAQQSAEAQLDTATPEELIEVATQLEDRGDNEVAQMFRELAAERAAEPQDA